MGKKDDDTVYCFELLKEGLTDRDMSGWGRLWCVGVGLIGTVVADPIIWASNKLGIKSEPKDYDPSDPTHPFNQNY